MFTIWSGASNGLDHRYHHPTMVSPHFGLSPVKPHPHSHFVAGSPAREDLGHAQVLTTKGKFIVIMDTRGYCPEELEVKTLDGFLIIRGETEETGKEEFKTSRAFCRRFLLPINCKEEELECLLGGVHDEDTILKVIIPRDVPDGMGILHRIAASGNGRSVSHVAGPYPLHHGHGYGHGHLENGYWVSGVECNRDRFVVKLELPRYSPDEIMVKTVDDFLVVEGNQMEKEDGELISCSFSRRYLLPVNADREGLECEINEEGRLKVIVPRINLGKTNHERIHKVERKQMNAPLVKQNGFK